MNLRFKKIRLCLLATVLLMMTENETLSLETGMEAAVGYNDNVPLLPDATGSAFTRYQMKLDHRFFFGSPPRDGDVFITGTYRDYFRTSDNYQLKAGGSLNYAFSEGRFLTGLSSEAMIYRDAYIPEDDRNEITAAFSADWLATARLTVGLRQSWTWADYRDPTIVAAPVQHHGSEGNGMGEGMTAQYGKGRQFGQSFGNKDKCRSVSENTPVSVTEGQMSPDQCGGACGEMTQLPRQISRNDRIQITGIQGTFFLTPEIQSDLLFEHRRLNSSADIESFRRNALSLSLLWMPSDLWEFSATAAWRRAEYDDEYSDRTDTLYSASLGISRFIGKFELFFQLEQTKNNSSLDSECFDQTVTQCGVSMSF